MGDVSAVLIIPAEGDPHSLLASGVCGARPPMAAMTDGAWHSVSRSPPPKCRLCSRVLSIGSAGGGQVAWVCAGGDWRNGPWQAFDDQPDRDLADQHYSASRTVRATALGRGEALVLAWAGEPVAEGCFRIWHNTDATDFDSGAHALLSLLFDPTPRDIAAMVGAWDLGTVVLLDADGLEITT